MGPKELSLAGSLRMGRPCLLFIVQNRANEWIMFMQYLNPVCETSCTTASLAIGTVQPVISSSKHPPQRSADDC
jgi:hypothetical protein